MNNFVSLLVVTLLLASSLTLAEADDKSADLRYCLEMKSNDEIAKCAGEISAGEKHKPLSKQEAEKILGKEMANAPDNANKPSITPAIVSDQPVKDLLLEKTESNGK